MEDCLILFFIIQKVKEFLSIITLSSPFQLRILTLCCICAICETRDAISQLQRSVIFT